MMFSVTFKIPFCIIGAFQVLALLHGQSGAEQSYVVLYSNENYRGASHRLLPGDRMESLDAINNFIWPTGAKKIGSIEIHGDITVEIWDQKLFQGKSVILSQSHARFDPVYPANQNWKGRIASIRVRSNHATPSSPRALAGQPPGPPAVSTPGRSLVADSQVRIYADAGFNGASLTYTRPASEQNLNYVSQSVDGWNDRISSIYIRGDFSVILYQDANFKGDSLRIDESVSHLLDLRRRDPNRRNWNEAVSSFEVLLKNEESQYSTNRQRYAGTLYEDDNFQGAYLTLFEGEEIRNLKDKHWNDQLSSVMVERGYKIILYQDSDFRGEHITIDLHQPSLRSFPGDWNDQVSSLRVVRDK